MLVLLEPVSVWKISIHYAGCSPVLMRQALLYCCTKLAQDCIKLSAQEIMPNLCCLPLKNINLFKLLGNVVDHPLATCKILLTFFATSLILLTFLDSFAIFLTYLG